MNHHYYLTIHCKTPAVALLTGTSRKCCIKKCTVDMSQDIHGSIHWGFPGLSTKKLFHIAETQIRFSELKLRRRPWLMVISTPPKDHQVVVTNWLFSVAMFALMDHNQLLQDTSTRTIPAGYNDMQLLYIEYGPLINNCLFQCQWDDKESTELLRLRHVHVYFSLSYCW